jgi:hypothetical protein
MKGHQMLNDADVIPAAMAMRYVDRVLVSREALDEGGSALSTPVVIHRV